VLGCGGFVVWLSTVLCICGFMVLWFSCLCGVVALLSIIFLLPTVCGFVVRFVVLFKVLWLCCFWL